jgi:hypothetical protein
MKTKIIVALSLLLGLTSASFASSHHHRGLQNHAPGYHARGGPGPRVSNGNGAGAGAESGSSK